MTHLTKTLKAKGMAAFAIGGFMAASLALTPVANAADELPGEGKSVKMARATWDTGYFPAEIYRKALQELGLVDADNLAWRRLERRRATSSHRRRVPSRHRRLFYRRRPWALLLRALALDVEPLADADAAEHLRDRVARARPVHGEPIRARRALLGELRAGTTGAVLLHALAERLLLILSLPQRARVLGR